VARTFAPSVKSVLTIDDYFFTGRQAIVDHRETILDRADLDRASLDRVIGLDHIGVIAVGADLQA
jgi:hypothetical protein